MAGNIAFEKKAKSSDGNASKMKTNCPSKNPWLLWNDPAA